MDAHTHGMYRLFRAARPVIAGWARNGAVNMGMNEYLLQVQRVAEAVDGASAVPERSCCDEAMRAAKVCRGGGYLFGDRAIEIMEEADIAVPGATLRGSAQVSRDSGAVCRGAMAYAGVLTDPLEETCRVGDRVSREAGVQVFEDFTVATPPTKGEVSGADKHMAFVRGGEDRHLRVEHAIGHRNGLDLIVLSDAVCALLADACTHAIDVGEDKGLRAPSPAHERVEDDGLEEGKAQRVGGEGDALPRMCLDKVDRRQSHGTISVALRRLSAICAAVVRQREQRLQFAHHAPSPNPDNDEAALCTSFVPVPVWRAVRSVQGLR